MAGAPGPTTSAEILISLYNKAQFVSNQPDGWIVDQGSGKLRCFNDAVNVMVHSAEKRIMGQKTFIEIRTQADLDAFMHQIRSKPLLTTALCSKPYSVNRDRYQNESVNVEDTQHTEEYVAMVNTAHPQISQMFQEAYDKTSQLLREDKKFRVTISLSESIKTWFINNVRMPNQTDSVTYATHCDLYLVNGVEEPTFFDRCCACEVITQKCFWCVCFPLFLLCFVPYHIYKKCVLGVVESSIKRVQPVIYHNAVFQNGFNIMSLLWPPGTSFTTVVSTGYYPPGVVQQQPGMYQQQPAGYQQQPAGYQQSAGYHQPQYQGNAPPPYQQ